MFERWVEDGAARRVGKRRGRLHSFFAAGAGLLTDKYLKGIPADSRAAKPHGFLQENQVTEAKLNKVRRLHQLAGQRGQTLAQMALAWLLKDPRITSVLIGASRPEQLEDSLQCLANTNFNADELKQIEDILQ
jgi:L-glyceraldehyde 3-phosphate reductase